MLGLLCIQSISFTSNLLFENYRFGLLHRRILSRRSVNDIDLILMIWWGSYRTSSSRDAGLYTPSYRKRKDSKRHKESIYQHTLYKKKLTQTAHPLPFPPSPSTPPLTPSPSHESPPDTVSNPQSSQPSNHISSQKPNSHPVASYRNSPPVHPAPPPPLHPPQSPPTHQSAASPPTHKNPSSPPYDRRVSSRHLLSPAKAQYAPVVETNLSALSDRRGVDT